MSQNWGGGGGSAQEKYPERQPDSVGLSAAGMNLARGGADSW